ncbi:MAG: gamma-glutamyl-gamma-aminobutyrate hydrolase family protein [bacterium]
MILYVIMETAEKYQEGNWHRQRLVMEKTSGDFCLMIHYKQLNLKMLNGLNPWAIVYSGASTPFEDYDVRQTRSYRQVVMQSTIPQLGICGGHQLAAEFFGSTLGIMHCIREDEADHNPKYHPGEFKEWGVYPVTVLKKDPLFAGMGNMIKVQQFHRSEIKKPGRDLLVLASSSACRVQAFRHRTKPFYGVQFHPEEAFDGYPDGFTILRNFFKWAAARQK